MLYGAKRDVSGALKGENRTVCAIVDDANATTTRRKVENINVISEHRVANSVGVGVYARTGRRDADEHRLESAIVEAAGRPAGRCVRTLMCGRGASAIIEHCSECDLMLLVTRIIMDVAYYLCPIDAFTNINLRCRNILKCYGAHSQQIT